MIARALPKWIYRFVTPVLAASIIAGCVNVTTRYGQPLEPVTNQPDTYRFTLYYSMIASSDGVARAADREAAKIMAERGYVAYEITHSTCIPSTSTYTVKYTQDAQAEAEAEAEAEGIKPGGRTLVRPGGARVREAAPAT